MWATGEWLLSLLDRGHRLGCHRPRIPDRVYFRGLLTRLVTGPLWFDIEAILERRLSDTTLRARRDEWIAVEVFDRLCGRCGRRIRQDRGP